MHEEASKRSQWQPFPYKPSIDGVRAIAVLAVLAYHGGFDWAQGGFLGVSLFFTLSGYLITRLLLAEFGATHRIDLLAFWARRLRRLAPAAVIALLGVLVLGALVVTPMERVGLRGDILATIAYVANWRFLINGTSYAQLFVAPSLVQHFWSLAIEEQFYFFYPCVVAGVFAVSRGSRRMLTLVIMALALGSLAVALMVGGADRVYFGTDTRALEVLAGALLALTVSPSANGRVLKRVFAVMGPAALLMTFLLWNRVGLGSAWLYEGGLALVAIVNVGVVQAAVVAGPVATVLGVRPLRLLGRISYGVYLYHWPIFLWLTESRTHLDGWPLFALRTVVTLTVAQLSYQFVEMPIRSGRRLRAPRFSRLLPVSLGGVAVASFLVIATPAADQLIASSYVAPTAVREPAGATKAVDAEGVPDPMRIYVVGDSTGLNVADGLSQWGKKTGHVVVMNGSVTACGLLRNASLRYPVNGNEEGKQDLEYCDDWPNRWRQNMADFRPDLVLVVMAPANTVDAKLPGDDEWRALGDTKVDDYLWKQMLVASDVLAAGQVPIVWFDSPYLGPNSRRLVGAQGDRSRIKIYNDLVARLEHARPFVHEFSWGAYVRSLSPDEYQTLLPDGVHTIARALGPFLDRGLWRQLRAKYVNAAGTAENASRIHVSQP